MLSFFFLLLFAFHLSLYHVWTYPASAVSPFPGWLISVYASTGSRVRSTFPILPFCRLRAARWINLCARLRTVVVNYAGNSGFNRCLRRSIYGRHLCAHLESTVSRGPWSTGEGRSLRLLWTEIRCFFHVCDVYTVPMFANLHSPARACSSIWTASKACALGRNKWTLNMAPVRSPSIKLFIEIYKCKMEKVLQWLLDWKEATEGP